MAGSHGVPVVLLSGDRAATAGVDQLLFIPGMERTGARTVRARSPDVPSAYRPTRLVRLLAR